ncbi:hypothetical protein FQA39_LY10910 [Lamprigera yunnana]|nr:hypothetical protein FQA39_LY10910 [Lamprigera yunnana]
MLKDPDQLQLQFIPIYELDQLEQLKSAADVHISCSEIYLTMLRSILHPYDSEMNTSPWKTLKEGSYYLGNAYRLVKFMNDMLVALEFDPKHIS